MISWRVLCMYYIVIISSGGGEDTQLDGAQRYNFYRDSPRGHAHTAWDMIYDSKCHCGQKLK